MMTTTLIRETKLDELLAKGAYIKDRINDRTVLIDPIGRVMVCVAREGELLRLKQIAIANRVSGRL